MYFDLEGLVRAMIVCGILIGIGIAVVVLGGGALLIWLFHHLHFLWS